LLNQASNLELMLESLPGARLGFLLKLFVS
jgi:hypothetical protein